MDLGIYIIQAACMMAGDTAPLAVTARLGEKTRADLFSDVEESIAWTMEFAEGLVCEGFTSHRQKQNYFRAEAPPEWIEMKEPFGYRGISCTTSRGPLNQSPSLRQQTLQMDDFARCIIDNRESCVSGEMGLRDMKIIAAIYQAAETGRRVAV